MATPALKPRESSPDRPVSTAHTLHHHIAASPVLPVYRTLRHLARCIREAADPDDTFRAILPHLERQYARAGPLSTPATTPATTRVRKRKLPSPRGHVLSLPGEMLGVVLDNLDPADAVCLAQTCGLFRRMLDCLAHDLPRFRLAWVFDRRALGMRFRDFVFEVTACVDRDRLRAPERECLRWNRRRSAEEEALRVCSVCITVHPASYFPPPPPLSLDPSQARTCLAALLPLRLCAHQSLSLPTPRRIRRHLLTGHAGALSLSQPRQTGCQGFLTFTLNARDELILTRELDILVCNTFPPERQVRAALALMATEPLCAHLRLGDRRVAEKFSNPLPAATARGRCGECATTWWFATRDNVEARGWRRCVLVVRRVVGDLQDPWGERWVGMVGQLEGPREGRCDALRRETR